MIYLGAIVAIVGWVSLPQPFGDPLGRPNSRGCCVGRSLHFDYPVREGRRTAVVES